MSSLASRLVRWEEFLELPERTADGEHYELQDGQVVVVPPPGGQHVALQRKIAELLRAAEEHGFKAATAFPYQPAAQYQYWVADVALAPDTVWEQMAQNKGYRVYAPPLIVEVLSRANTPEGVHRKRLVAMSGGTVEFWTVDADQRTVEVTTLDSVRTYGRGERIPLAVTGGIEIPVDGIFEDLL
jgi:Uma2 family endonuclease